MVKKKFKYTVDEESDTNMILEQEYESNIKAEKSITNAINLRLLSYDTILWRKAAIFLLQIKVRKTKDNENFIYEKDEFKIKNKTLEYLFRLTNNTKEYRKFFEVSDEKQIKQIIIDYIKLFTYKIKLLIIYLEKGDGGKNEDESEEDIEEEEEEDKEIFYNDNGISENININSSTNNNVINCENNNNGEELNDSGFRNDIFIDLFSSNEINVPFYVITKKYLYAKLFNKKMNYIFMNNDFLYDKVVKVLLFHDKKISPHNSKNNLSENNNKNNEPIIITTRGFLPEFKETKINIEGSTSSTLSLSSDEDYLDNSVIYTRNGIGILQFKINES